MPAAVVTCISISPCRIHSLAAGSVGALCLEEVGQAVGWSACSVSRAQIPNPVPKGITIIRVKRGVLDCGGAASAEAKVLGSCGQVQGVAGRGAGCLLPVTAPSSQPFQGTLAIWYQEAFREGKDVSHRT